MASAWKVLGHDTRHEREMIIMMMMMMQAALAGLVRERNTGLGGPCTRNFPAKAILTTQRNYLGVWFWHGRRGLDWIGMLLRV